MVVKDDRTPAERITHRIIILGIDTFMSGWGEARNGSSYAGWACTLSDAVKVERWVRARGDQKRVRVVLGNYRPEARYCAHYHIYTVNAGHPSLA